MSNEKETKEDQAERLTESSFVTINKRLKERIDHLAQLHMFPLVGQFRSMTEAELLLTVVTEELCQVYKRLGRAEQALQLRGELLSLTCCDCKRTEVFAPQDLVDGVQGWYFNTETGWLCPNCDHP